MFAESAKTAVLCAIKQCRAQKPTDDIAKLQNNLLQEAEIMLKLCHPNIIRCLGVCIEGARSGGAAKAVYAVMEFMDLGDLRQYLKVCLPAYISVLCLGLEET